MSQYFCNVLVMDIGISPQQQEQYKTIPEGLLGIWYFDELINHKPCAVYVHLDENAEGDDENFYQNILVFPDSIIAVSPEEVKFYGRMID